MEIPTVIDQRMRHAHTHTRTRTHIRTRTHVYIYIYIGVDFHTTIETHPRTSMYSGGFRSHRACAQCDAGDRRGAPLGSSGDRGAPVTLVAHRHCRHLASPGGVTRRRHVAASRGVSHRHTRARRPAPQMKISSSQMVWRPQLCVCGEIRVESSRSAACRR